MNTTKRVRKIVRDCMKKHNVGYTYTWTDKRFFGDPSRKERYVTFMLDYTTEDANVKLLDSVKKYMRMNGIVDCKPRLVSGYLRMNSFLG